MHLVHAPLTIRQTRAVENSTAVGQFVAGIACQLDRVAESSCPIDQLCVGDIRHVAVLCEENSVSTVASMFDG